MKIIEVAINYRNNGLSVIPTDRQTKQPVFSLLPKSNEGKSTWEPFKNQIADINLIHKWFDNVHNNAIAVICGNVSGGLELLDFDNHFGDATLIFNEWSELVKNYSIELFNCLVIETTQSGGYHVFFRSDFCGGNEKLASKINAKNKPDATIETKGEGGYALIAPTENYTLIQNDFLNIPFVSQEQRNLLIDAARSFNEYVKDNSSKDEVYIANTRNDKPGDDYNKRGDVVSLLQSCGWSITSKFNGKINLCRPGKKSGVSATFNAIPDKFYNFSANSDPFEPNKTYDKFAVYTMLKCNGDFKQAAKELLSEGYGTPTKYKNIAKNNNVITKIESKVKNDKDFWFEFTHKNNEPQLNVHRTNLIIFLENKGFCKYLIDTNRYCYVRVVDNIVTEQTTETIIDYLKNYVYNLPFNLTDNFSNTDLWEFILKKISTFRAKDFLETLSPKKLEFIRDEANKGYFFFKNGIVEVSANTSKLLPYSAINKVVWNNHIINKDLKLLNSDVAGNTTNSQFGKFIQNICSKANPEFPDDRTKRTTEPQRLLAIITAIGYMLHTYKNPALTKAVILCEEKIANTDESNGRTGKGLTVKAITLLRKELYFNGKNIDFNNQFFYQNVTKDTQLLYFDDIKKNFPFESIFSLQTEGVIVEQKGQKPYKIPFEESPKVIITTNYVISNDSDSHKARKFEFEFSDYYSADFSPFDEFGQYFFSSDWEVNNNEEWNNFYSFMIYCLQCFLDMGLNSYSTGNLEYRKILQLIPEEFIDMYPTFIEILKNEGQITKTDIYEKFVNLNQTYNSKGKNAISQKITTKWFTKMLDYYKVDAVQKQVKMDGIITHCFKL